MAGRYDQVYRTLNELSMLTNSDIEVTIKNDELRQEILEEIKGNFFMVVEPPEDQVMNSASFTFPGFNEIKLIFK